MKKFTLFLVAATVSVSSMLYADLNMYDGFDAPLGNSITNTTGGSGWLDSNWSVALTWNSPLDSSDSQVVDGLNYNDGVATLQTSGNAIRVSPVVTIGSNEGWCLKRASTESLVDTGTTWESYLVRTGDELHASNSKGVFASSTQSDNASYFGPQWTTYFRFMNGTGAAASSVDLTIDTTYFVVMRLDSTGGNNATAYAWINPSLTEEPDVVDADATITRSMQVGDGMLIHNKRNNASGAIQGVATYDEFRQGTTFADVAPVAIPEPSTGILTLIASLLFCRFKK